MAKKHVFIELNGYSVTKYTRRCEDIELWFRFFAKNFSGFNMKESLYHVRVDDSAYRRRKFMSYIYATKVCFDGYRLLKVPLRIYLYLFKPVITAFIPSFLKKTYQYKRLKR